MGIFTTVQFSFIFECISIISSLLWEIKYLFFLLPRPVRISWIWFTQKPAREFFRRTFNPNNRVRRYYPVIYVFSEMKIPLQNVKVNANLPMWIVHWPAPTPTASLNVEESWLIVSKVRDFTILFMTLIRNILSPIPYFSRLSM